MNNCGCWICGKTENLTQHHVIPKTYNPINNITIPLCEECHKKLHEFDENLAIKHLEKTRYQMKNIEKSMEMINKSLNKNTLSSKVVWKHGKKP